MLPVPIHVSLTGVGKRSMATTPSQRVSMTASHRLLRAYPISVYALSLYLGSAILAACASALPRPAEVLAALEAAAEIPAPRSSGGRAAVCDSDVCAL